MNSPSASRIRPPSATLTPVKAFSVQAYASRIDEGRSSEVYLATLRNPAKIQKAYVKVSTEPQENIAELIASQIGRALGLPIPEPFLVLCDSRELPQDSAFYESGLHWVFASAQHGTDPISIEHLYRKNESLYREVINRWAIYDHAAAFDEYIANDDRNQGNLVYCPSKKEIALIDHGRCLGVGQGKLLDLKPDYPVANQLVDSVLPLDDAEKHQLSKVANDLMRHCELIDFSGLPPTAELQKIQDGTQRSKIVDFLKTRIHFTVELLCQRMGMPQLPLTNPTH